MQIVPRTELNSKKCAPCEGGVDACSLEHSSKQLQMLPGWQLSQDAKWIHKKWQFKHFLHAVSCITRIADLAEAEAHHPDLHLTGYQHLEVAISTHAIDGLSENDFILAAKIETLINTNFPKAVEVR
jgi:4a-hydroxytetrahydrobiopterin dehydratase